MYHPLTLKTIIAIQNRQGALCVLPDFARRLATTKAQLYHAATVGNDQDAREQLRLLAAITPEAHDKYMNGGK